jgi:hypothetical protein
LSQLAICIASPYLSLRLGKETSLPVRVLPSPAASLASNRTQSHAIVKPKTIPEIIIFPAAAYFRTSHLGALSLWKTCMRIAFGL